MSHDPGPYNVQRLRDELARQLPDLVRGLPSILTGLAGPDRVGLPARLAYQLRMARLLGCPVCLELFPRLGPHAGLPGEAVSRATEGQLEGLLPQEAGAVAWAEAVITGDGAEPELVPGPAMALTTGQRAHLLQMARLELVVHAAWLMFLPHSMIQRALGLS